jgi:excisionase family DNA binding protein
MSVDKANLFADGTMTVTAAANYSCVSRTEVYRWMDEERLPFVRFYRDGMRLIPRRGLITFLESRALALNRALGCSSR